MKPEAVFMYDRPGKIVEPGINFGLYERFPKMLMLAYMPPSQLDTVMGYSILSRTSLCSPSQSKVGERGRQDLRDLLTTYPES